MIVFRFGEDVAPALKDERRFARGDRETPIVCLRERRGEVGGEAFVGGLTGDCGGERLARES